mgnify:CR=1 FL=1
MVKGPLPWAVDSGCSGSVVDRDNTEMHGKETLPVNCTLDIVGDLAQVKEKRGKVQGGRTHAAAVSRSSPLDLCVTWGRAPRPADSDTPVLRQRKRNEKIGNLK